jgi:hypothetical protein
MLDDIEKSARGTKDVNQIYPDIVKNKITNPMKYGPDEVIKLNEKQYKRYQQLIGQETKNQYGQLADDTTFNNLSVDEKIKIIIKLKDKINQDVKVQMLQELGKW